MYKQASYQEKFRDLDEWMPWLVEVIKKDLRHDHLKKDVYFVKKFLQAKNIHRVTSEELAQAYRQAMREEERGEAIAEFLASRWLFKNSEMYAFFEKHLSQINADFTRIEALTAAQSKELIALSIGEFGALNTYLFAVLNSVVFPQESFILLQGEARAQQQRQLAEEAQALEASQGEASRQAWEASMARLTDKYEKKLAGLQKKYDRDMEHLKKQIAALQRRLTQS